MTDVTVVSENVDTDLQDVDGLFTFGLVQYMDSAMSDPAGADDQTPLGGTMYFQLTMANPVSTLDWVITGKYENVSFTDKTFLIILLMF